MQVNNIIDWNSLSPQQQLGHTIQANNEWSAAQAQKQMDFQRELSDTAHQREIADLKAAGLNPVLSAKLGGASTPSGAMGTTDTSGTGALVDLLTLSMETANSAARAAAGISQGNPYSANGTDIFGLNPADYKYKNPRSPAQMAWNAAMSLLERSNIQVNMQTILDVAQKIGIDVTDILGKGNQGDANSAEDVRYPENKPVAPKWTGIKDDPDFSKWRSAYGQYLKELEEWIKRNAGYARGNLPQR